MTNNHILSSIQRPAQLALGAALALALTFALSTSAMAQETTTTAEESTTTAEETTTTAAEETTTTAEATTTTADSDDGAAPAGGADTGAGGTSQSSNTGLIALMGLGAVVLGAGATVGVRRASVR